MFLCRRPACFQSTWTLDRQGFPQPGFITAVAFIGDLSIATACVGLLTALRQLERMGFQVEVAAHGQEVLNWSRAAPLNRVAGPSA